MTCGMRHAPWVVAIAFAFAVAPAEAAAGTAQLVRQPGDERENPSESLEYSAAPGELNRLTLAFDGRAVLVTDTAGVTAGRGCARVGGDPNRARCAAGGDAEILGLTALLGDGDDTADDTTGARIEGGDGNDTLTGSGFTGGARGESAELLGGPGQDTLRGDTLAGGPGDDTLTISYTDDQNPFGTIDESDADNGSDTIRGGSARDLVSYEGRRLPVRVDLRAASGAGQAGENDRITDVESADGGRANDVLIGTAGPNRLRGGGGSDQILGGAGDDTLYAVDGVNLGGRGHTDRIVGGAGDDDIGGSNGPNSIQPGVGEDKVDGAGGNDRIGSRDGSIDSAICGGGRRDRVRADALDFVPLSCEQLARNGAAQAVPLGITVGTTSDFGPGVTVGCSRDGPRVCETGISVFRGSRRLATRRKRVRRGRAGFTLFPKRLRRLADESVRIRVTARDRRGRPSSVTRTLVVQTVS
jgi:hypothetical protein